MNTATQGLGRGERATDFVLPIDGDGTPTRFYARAGGMPAVLIFFGGDEEDKLLRLSRVLEAQAVSVFGVKAGRQPEAGEAEMPFPVFLDTQGAVWSAYRLGDVKEPILFVLDPNLRVLGSLCLGEVEASAEAVHTILGSPRVEPLEIKIQAPVLLIPNVLDGEICAFLIQVWENQGNVETGVEQSHGARREETIDYENKNRRDHVVRDEKLMKMLSSTVGRRVMPEVQRAFAFRATRFEGFKVACYDSESGGFFHAHRDNLSPATAHRRFALTLNLNEGYSGGFLRFPEFGPHLYRPEAGGAVVFSCSHLHEVTAVTQGRRFTLLSFLFGEGDVRVPREQTEKGRY